MTVSGTGAHADQRARADLVDLLPLQREAPAPALATGQKLVLCASTGGHLAELVRLAEHIDLHPDSLWITFDSPQSRDLLGDRRTLFVPYVEPRDALAVVRAGIAVHRFVSGEQFDGAISTGAAVTVGAFAALGLQGVPLTYVESLGRVDGPSLTGRILAASRSIRLFTQHRSWAGGRWTYGHSILDSFHSERRAVPVAPRRILVTLGTIRPYRFDTAVDAVRRTGLANDETQWQLGATSRSDLPGTTFDVIDPNAFARAAAAADVVVTHAGVGTLLQLLDLGICPVVVVRRSARGEHVDDHQEQVARMLGERRLAVVCEAEDLTAAHLEQAAGRVIVARSKATGNRSDLAA